MHTCPLQNKPILLGLYRLITGGTLWVHVAVPYGAHGDDGPPEGRRDAGVLRLRHVLLCKHPLHTHYTDRFFCINFVT